MYWSTQFGFGSHARGWLAVVILVSCAASIALLRLLFWFLTRKRDADEVERESDDQYWRTHGE